MEFICIATAHFVALLSPGPDFILIIQAALRLPLRYGIAICAGIAAANGVYLLLAVAGLEAVSEWRWLVTLLRYGGSCYLIYLGFLLLTSPRQQPEEDKAGHRPLKQHHVGRQFLLGFLSALLNPKNMIFYLSLFTAMVSAETTFATRCLYGLWMTAVVMFWDCLLVLLVQRTRFTSLLRSKIFYLEKGSGTVLAFLGVTLLFG